MILFALALQLIDHIVDHGVISDVLYCIVCIVCIVLVLEPLYDSYSGFEGVMQGVTLPFAWYLPSKVR